MTPIEQLARKVVEAIFDRAEEDGALHKDSAVDVARRVLLTGMRRGPAREVTFTTFDEAPKLDLDALLRAQAVLDAKEIPEGERYVWPHLMPIPAFPPPPMTATEVKALQKAADERLQKSGEDVMRALAKAVTLGFKLPKQPPHRSAPGDLPQTDD